MTESIEAGVRSLQKGGNVALNDLTDDLGHLTAVLEVDDTPSGDHVDMDVSVLLLSPDGRVRSDADFVFYNQPTAGGGAVRLHEAIRDDDARRFSCPVAVRLEAAPHGIARIVLVASLDGATGLHCGDPSGMRLRLRSGDSSDLLVYDVASEGTEAALLFGEFYRRDTQWRFRAIGQGYGDGLAGIAEQFGVDVEGSPTPDSGSPLAAPTASAIETAAVTGEPAPPAPVKRRVAVRRARRPPRMPEPDPEHGSEGHHPARLFPIAGIGGHEEQERRATSSLLALMALVRPFGHALLRPLGAPGGSIHTFEEVSFDLDGRTYRPDGLIETKWGDHTFNCLVEVKTGTAPLRQEQVEAYIEIARRKEFDAVLTISNQITGVLGEHPVAVDRRKLRKVSLHHLSWDEIRTTAALMTRQDRTGDPMGTRVLAEFVRYIEYDRSGLHGMVDMGPQWPKVRAAVRSRTLSSGSEGAAEVCERFDQLVRHIALHLTRVLGVEVASVVPRHTPDQATRRQQLADSGLLFGSVKVPGAAATIVLRADLRAERIQVSMTIKAPRKGKSLTRVHWMVRHLDAARADMRLSVLTTGEKVAAAASVGAVRDDPQSVLPEQAVEVREFEVSLDLPMGTKRLTGRGSMISSATAALDQFYGEVGQHVRIWKP